MDAFHPLHFSVDFRSSSQLRNLQGFQHRLVDILISLRELLDLQDFFFMWRRDHVSVYAGAVIDSQEYSLFSVYKSDASY